MTICAQNPKNSPSEHRDNHRSLAQELGSL